MPQTCPWFAICVHIVRPQKSSSRTRCIRWQSGIIYSDVKQNPDHTTKEPPSIVRAIDIARLSRDRCSDWWCATGKNQSSSSNNLSFKIKATATTTSPFSIATAQQEDQESKQTILVFQYNGGFPQSTASYYTKWRFHWLDGQKCRAYVDLGHCIPHLGAIPIQIIMVEQRHWL